MCFYVGCTFVNFDDLTVFAGSIDASHCKSFFAVELQL